STVASIVACFAPGQGCPGRAHLGQASAAMAGVAPAGWTCGGGWVSVRRGSQLALKECSKKGNHGRERRIGMRPWYKRLAAAAAQHRALDKMARARSL